MAGLEVKQIIRIVLLLLVANTSCFAAENYGDFNNVKYVRNYDGDTITFNIPGVHPIIGDNISVRVEGIDTPEKRGKCNKEKILAKKAQKKIEHVLQHAGNITLKNIGRGKYFRIVATVIADGKDIKNILISKGLAVPYDGGKKTKNWCE